MNKTQLEHKKILEEIINQVISHTTNFQKLIKANWEKVTEGTTNKVTKEYLAFVMYCAVFMLQNNESSEQELEAFHKSFYDAVVKKGLLKKGELLDYEKLSRKRYMDFYRTLSDGNEEQVTGKRLNALVAKEALYIQELLSEFKEKRDAISELYSELFAVYSGLMLQIQLMSLLGDQVEKQEK